MACESSSLDPGPRILIVRLSAIGDVIHGMPAVCALRRRFPDACLTWVVETTAASLLQGHDALDELIVLPRGWLKSPATVWRLRRQLRGLRFDTAIDLQGLTKSAVVSWICGARRRIGLGRPWGRELSRWLNTELVDTMAEHAVDRTLELLGPLGIESPEVQFQVPEDDEDRASAEEIIRRADVQQGFAIISSGAGWPSKVWPKDRYAAVAAYLGRTHGLPTLVVAAGTEERKATGPIVAGSDGYAQLAPRTTLRELAALSRRCRLFIGSDTGPLHLAAAVGTPCVGLYGPWPAERHGPYGAQHVVVQKMCMDGSTRQRRRAPPTCMEAIDVESVCAACDEILGRGGRDVA